MIHALHLIYFFSLEDFRESFSFFPSVLKVFNNFCWCVFFSSCFVWCTLNSENWCPWEYFRIIYLNFTLGCWTTRSLTAPHFIMFSLLSYVLSCTVFSGKLSQFYFQTSLNYILLLSYFLFLKALFVVGCSFLKKIIIFIFVLW